MGAATEGRGGMRCRAYFIDGPKHGDVDFLPEGHNIIRIPTATAPAQTDFGHYSTPAASASYGVGEYRREVELRLHDHHRDRAFMYMWQGVR